jgi:hypothetical protein
MLKRSGLSYISNKFNLSSVVRRGSIAWEWLFMATPPFCLRIYWEISGKIKIYNRTLNDAETTHFIEIAIK